MPSRQHKLKELFHNTHTPCATGIEAAQSLLKPILVSHHRVEELFSRSIEQQTDPNEGLHGLSQLVP